MQLCNFLVGVLDDDLRKYGPHHPNVINVLPDFLSILGLLVRLERVNATQARGLFDKALILVECPAWPERIVEGVDGELFLYHFVWLLWFLGAAEPHLQCQLAQQLLGIGECKRSALSNGVMLLCALLAIANSALGYNSLSKDYAARAETILQVARLTPTAAWHEACASGMWLATAAQSRGERQAEATLDFLELSRNALGDARVALEISSCMLYWSRVGREDVAQWLAVLRDDSGLSVADWHAEHLIEECFSYMYVSALATCSGLIVAD